MAASPAWSRFHPTYQAAPRRRALRRPRTALAALLAALCATAVPAVTVPAAAPPIVSSVSPRTSLVLGGGTATITGSGFTGTTNVLFGVSYAPSHVVNDSTLTATIPSSRPYEVHVTVQAGGQISQTSAADRFVFYENRSGELTGGPDAASWGDGRVDLFVRGNDGAVWHSWEDPTNGWSNWYSVGGGVAADNSNGVGAVAWGQGRIDVFVRGNDNALWHKWWSGAGWSGWFSLGGTLTSGPDAASWAAGRLDVFARGINNGLWHKWWDGASWSGWEPLGGGLSSDPGAVSWGPNRIDVFVRGTDNGLWHRSWDGAKWIGWEPLGGSLTSGPDPAAPAVGQLEVFYRAQDGNVWGRGYTGAWRPSRSLYLDGSGPPGAVSSGCCRSAVYVRTSSNTLRLVDALAE